MQLRYYLIRRLVLIVPVLIGLSIITFMISHMVPGDPVRLAAGPQASKQELEALTVEFGLDKPLHIQYLNYMKGLLRGDLGRSMLDHHLVRTDLLRHFPATLELAIVATILAIVIGVPAGVAAAVFRDKWPDQTSRILSISSISMPNFWLAIMLQLILVQHLGILPLSGRFDARTPFPPHRTGLLLVDALLAGDLTSFGLALKHMILPAFCQSLFLMATLTRMVRSDVLEVMHKDFVMMARASGLPERIILFKYVLKNALIATVTMIGFFMGWALSGSVMIETVFDWPGIGLYAMKSAMSLDFQPIMGITLCVGLVFTLINLFVDISYGVLDPRIRYG